MGRQYGMLLKNDMAELYKTFGGYTIVAVFNPTDSSGMNRNGIFLELNSGNWGAIIPTPGKRI